MSKTCSCCGGTGVVLTNEEVDALLNEADWEDGGWGVATGDPSPLRRAQFNVSFSREEADEITRMARFHKLRVTVWLRRVALGEWELLRTAKATVTP